jgi:hypothetical protein
VFEHVGEAAGALGVVGGACVDEGVEAEDGRFGALADDERKAVRKNFYCGALFEACEILRLAPQARTIAIVMIAAIPPRTPAKAASKMIVPRV